ncbi:hypothetical protein COSO111634_34590 [Corallococcus soli]
MAASRADGEKYVSTLRQRMKSNRPKRSGSGASRLAGAKRVTLRTSGMMDTWRSPWGS